MSVENLSSWLHIEIDTVHLIIQYAKKDMALVRYRKFAMDPTLRDPGPWEILDLGILNNLQMIWTTWHKFRIVERNPGV
jgi:hypothetical protein